MDKNRYRALNILDSIMFRNAKIKDAMEESISSHLSEVDRAFIMELAYGCTRYKLYLEWILGNFVKDTKRLGGRTFINLILGLYQLHFMRTSDWAAVHETVEVEKKIGGIPSLVNAVLRNYIRKKNHLSVPSLSDDPTRHISISTSHPEWLVLKWMERFSPEEVLALAEANNQIPPLTLRVNTLVTGMDEVTAELKKRGVLFSLSRLSPDGIVLANTPFSAIADLRGKVFVQDEAAQMISYLLDPREGSAILDACAAPGGKATHIAQITRNGSAITAVEVDENRLKLLNDNIRSSGARSVSAVRLDILDYRSVTSFDRILLDAPCSALGVIRRNPDVKYRHSPEALRKFGIKQLEILNHVSSLLKRGGTMVYSVCSTEPEETRDVIAGFLNNKKDFYIIDTIHDVNLPEPFTRNLQELFNEEGFMITYPHVHHVDGFFAARLGRK